MHHMEYRFSLDVVLSLRLVMTDLRHRFCSSISGLTDYDGRHIKVQ